MNKPTKYILSACVAVLPINFVMIWYRLSRDVTFSPTEMIMFPLIFGGSNILLILGLNKYFLKQKTSIFNEGDSNWKKDLIASLGLTILYFVMFFLERITLHPLLAQNTPLNLDLINALQNFSQNPVMLILWFGPVLWIGIALYEELSRVFLIKALWSVSKNKTWIIASIFLSSILIGVVHLYQGWYGIITIGLKSILMCAYYYKFQRIGPLIISHALYDGIQFLCLLIEIIPI